MKKKETRFGDVDPGVARSSWPARIGGILSVLLLSLGMRCLLVRQVFVGEKTYFFDTDPYYHMRRIFLTLSSYPHVSPFDFYVNFPTGAWINWPGGFDLLLATVSLVLGLGHPSLVLTERVCACSVPVLGTLTVWVFYRIAREFLPVPQALFAALLLALCGSHILVSRIGRVDHHVLEILLPAMAYLFFFRSLGAAQYSKRMFLGVLSGTAFGLSFGIWTGSVMFLGTFVLYLLFQQMLYASHGPVPCGLRQSGTVVLCTTALVILPLCATGHWGKQGEVTYVALSWFHFLVPVYGLVAFLFMNRYPIVRTRGPKGFFLQTLALLGVCLCLLLVTRLVKPDSVQTLRDAWEFLALKEVQIDTVAESRSVLALKASSRTTLYGPLLPLLPLLGLYALVRSYRAGSERPGGTLLVFWFFSTGVLAALQVRFTPAFSLPMCLYWTFLVSDLVGCLERFGQRRARGRLYGWLGLPVTLSLVLAFLQSALAQPPQRSIPALLAVFEDIRGVTPETGSFLDPVQKPEYGILSHWSYGHFLNYLSRRPNIANPFGQAEWHLHGVRESYRFLLAQDETEAEAVCNRLEARYALVASIASSQSAFSRFLALLFPDRLQGLDPKDYLREHYSSFMNNRLLLQDGLATQGPDEHGRALRHFRLVHESTLAVQDSITQMETSFFKLFEHVPGARLIGLAPAHEVLELEVPIETNLGRRFVYTQKILTGDRGGFETTLPYSTQGSPYRCGPRGPWRLLRGDVTRVLEVSEEAVREGLEVQVDLR